VGAALANFDEAEPFKARNNLASPKNRTARHDYAT
jgi:hypothetical protein